jgi:hypothetical protein
MAAAEVTTSHYRREGSRPTGEHGDPAGIGKTPMCHVGQVALPFMMIYAIWPDQMNPVS